MSLLERIFGPISKDRFARQFMRRLRQAGEKRRIFYDPARFRVMPDGPEGVVLNLGNAYDEYLAMPPNQRGVVLRTLVKSWFAHGRGLPEAFEDLHPDLLPCVRMRSYYDLNELQLRVDGHKGLSWPRVAVADHLAASLVYDMPDAIRSITQADLDGWSVTFDEAFAAACTNLWEMSRHVFERPRDGLYVSPWRDNHDISRLLLPALVAYHEVEGRHVAVAPNRNTLLVTGEDDPAGLAAMVDLAEAALEAPRAMSGHAVVLEDGRWEPWLPPTEHPAHARFKALAMQTLASDYEHQRRLLEQRHQQQGDELFVASYAEVENHDSGVPFSYCVWSEGITSLLPQTDMIAFVAEGKRPQLVSWQSATEAFGHLLVEQDGYPPRWRVEEFPASGDLAQVRLEV